MLEEGDYGDGRLYDLYSTEEAAREALRRAVLECARRHGVTLPSPLPDDDAELGLIIGKPGHWFAIGWADLHV